MMRERSELIDDAALRQLEKEMETDLRNLRESATVYAERAWARSSSLTALGNQPHSTWRIWAVGATAAAVLVAGGVRLAHGGDFWTIRDSPQSAAALPQPGSPSVSDEALLEQIQSDLSTGVPTAMQPLEASDTRNSSLQATNHNE